LDPVTEFNVNLKMVILARQGIQPWRPFRETNERVTDQNYTLIPTPGSDDINLY